MNYLHYFEKRPVPPVFEFEIGDIVRLDNGMIFKESPSLFRIIDRQRNLMSGKRKNAKRDKMGYLIYDKPINSYKLEWIIDDPVKAKFLPKIWKKEKEIKKASDFEIDTIKYNL